MTTIPTVCEKKRTVGLCDRGTLDGLAYWPSGEDAFWEMSRTKATQEYQKYYAVIHLRSPSDQFGYNQINLLRIENSIQAIEIDEKIPKALAGHENYHVIASSENVLTKAQAAMKLISKYMPDCCKEGVNEI